MAAPSLCSILVVDDSPLDRRAVGELLKAIPDVELAFAGSVDEAEALLHGDPESLPSVVVTDLIMPDRDGLELVSLLVHEHPLIPVILMTGLGSEETAVRALQAGAASYVTKTSLSHRLVETVEHVLAMAHEQHSQKRLMGSMVRSDCEFRLENDPAMIPALINYLHRSIRSVGLCDENEGIRVCVALEEAVNNAMFHGNLELQSHLREDDLGQYRQEMDRRRREPPFRDRSVVVRSILSGKSGEFQVLDEGPGFDPARLPDPTSPENIERATGRGLLLMRTFMDEVRFNEQGNHVTLIKNQSQRPPRS